MRARITGSLLAVAAAILLAAMTAPAHADDITPTTPAVTSPSPTPTPTITPLDTYWGS